MNAALQRSYQERDQAPRDKRAPIYSDDLPAEYVRFLLDLPGDYPVISRVNQIRETYRRPA